MNKGEITFWQPEIGEYEWTENLAPDVFDEKVERKFLDRVLSDPNHWLILASQGEKVIGKCTAIVHLRPDKPDELYIDEIDVAPEFRRQTIARRMMDHILELADQKGIDECWVATEEDNIPAKALYASTGAKMEEVALYYLEW